jgi:hypothetical protein
LDSPRVLEESVGLIPVIIVKNQIKRIQGMFWSKRYHLYPIKWRRSCKIDDNNNKFTP